MHKSGSYYANFIYNGSSSILDGNTTAYFTSSSKDATRHLFKTNAQIVIIFIKIYNSFNSYFYVLLMIQLTQ